MFAIAESAVSCRSAAILLATKSGHEVPAASAVNAITYGFIPANRSKKKKKELTIVQELTLYVESFLMEFSRALCVCVPVTQLIRSVSPVTTKATPLIKRSEQIKAIQP